MLLSIIVPVYNTEKEIEQCLYSILKQVDNTVEVIVIDDGSTDSSGNIADTIAQKWTNLKVFHNSNQGVASARNFGLNHARGQYITFVDSDDYWMDGIFSQYKEKYLSGDYDLIYARNYVERYPNGKERQRFRHLDFRVDNKSVFNLICDNTRKGGWSNCLCFFKRSIIDQNSIRYRLGARIGEDAEFFYEYCKHVINPAVSDDAYYVYNVNRNGSAMTQKSIQSIVSYLNLVEQREEIFQTTQDPNDLEILKILTTNFFEYIKWFECCNKNEKQSFISRIENKHLEKYVTNDNPIIASIKKNGYSKTIKREWNRYKRVQLLKTAIKKLIRY